MKKQKRKRKIVIKSDGIIPIIQPTRLYKVGEIYKEKLLPGLPKNKIIATRYISRLLSQKTENGNFIPQTTTHKEGIKPIVKKNKIRNSFLVEGVELIKFLKFNDII